MRESRRHPQWVEAVSGLQELSKWVTLLAKAEAQLVLVIPIQNTDLYHLVYRSAKKVDWSDD